MTVRVVDNGANKVLRLGRRKVAVRVGVLGSKAGAKKGDVTVAQVAEWAEFGIGQPERSWLRGWIDAHESEIQARIDKEYSEVIRGKRSEDQALNRIGLWLQGQIQLNIADFPGNGFEPNADSTIERKGSSTPLIDTGQLRSSISYEIEK